MISHVTRVFITPVNTHVISLGKPEEAAGKTRCSLTTKPQLSFSVYGGPDDHTDCT